jgi:hypothetical protein
VDAEEGRHRLRRPPLVDQAPAQGDLVGAELPRPSEAHTALPGGHPPAAGALVDEGAFELCGMHCSAYGRLCSVRDDAESGIPLSTDRRITS